MRRKLSYLLCLSLLLGGLAACRQVDPPAVTEEDTTVSEETVPTVTLPAETQTPDHTEEPMEAIDTYQNPLLTADSDNAWPGYGFGDPFVMRHNGVYYLYVSTKDGSVGVRCWSSKDLVNWSFEGYCTNQSQTRGAYAPEVYYYNGYFYMYTSPAGNGHYVLRSEHPTKGFEVVTNNLGMSIDGSVFIDNDGKWYFYTANHGAMMAYTMTSPTAFRNGTALRSISVNGAWTEGPMVVYHDGYYYMTYTGNHVLSPSYRILYGSSDSSPVQFESSYAPLLINTSPEILGIGHSSTVKGPDLDSYYIVYHSLVNKTPNRNMSIDRIVFNGGRMSVMGPTVTQQQVPSMPDIYHHFAPGSSLKGWSLLGGLASGSGLTLSEGSSLISKTGFDGDFTAEYNITDIAEGGKAGALFAYSDEKNFGSCLFDPATQTVVITVTVDGVASVTEVDTVRSFGEDTRFDCLQSLQIERYGRDYTFYMNDRLLCVISDCPLTGGAIGYTAVGGQASFGFIGGTGAVGGRGASETYKSVSELNGLIPANTCMEEEIDFVTVDGMTAVMAEAGDRFTYRILASSDGAYDLSLFCAAMGEGAVEVLADGRSVGSVRLTQQGVLATEGLRGIELSQGQHLLTLIVTEGQAALVKMDMLKAEAVPQTPLDLSSPAYSDGNWIGTDGALGTSTGNMTGKRLYGSKNWGDYAVEAKITLKSGANGGLLVRATNPGASSFLNDTPTAGDCEFSTDWVQGYYIGLSKNAVIVGKQAYGWQELAVVSADIGINTPHVLRVECLGATVKVFVDGQLCVEYTDREPFLQGMVGARAFSCGLDVRKITVEPLE